MPPSDSNLITEKTIKDRSQRGYEGIFFTFLIQNTLQNAEQQRKERQEWRGKGKQKKGVEKLLNTKCLANCDSLNLILTIIPVLLSGVKLVSKSFSCGVNPHNMNLLRGRKYCRVRKWWKCQTFEYIISIMLIKYTSRKQLQCLPRLSVLPPDLEPGWAKREAVDPAAESTKTTKPKKDRGCHLMEKQYNFLYKRTSHVVYTSSQYLQLISEGMKSTHFTCESCLMTDEP